MTISNAGDVSVRTSKSLILWSDEQKEAIDSALTLESFDEVMEMLPFNVTSLPGNYTSQELFAIKSISNVKLTKRTIEMNVQFTNPGIIGMSKSIE